MKLDAARALSLWDWTVAVVSMVGYFVAGYFILSQLTRVPGPYRLLLLWFASWFLVPAFAALAGVFGLRRVSQALNVVGVVVAIGGLVVCGVVLLSKCALDVVSNL